MDRMRQRIRHTGTAIIMLLIHGQVSTIRDDVPSQCSRRCGTDRVIVGVVDSITELMFMTTIRVVNFLKIGALVTLISFGLPGRVAWEFSQFFTMLLYLFIL